MTAINYDQLLFGLNSEKLLQIKAEELKLKKKKIKAEEKKNGIFCLAMTNKCEKSIRLNFRCVPKEKIKNSEENERCRAENVVKCFPSKHLRLAELSSQRHR